MNNLQPIQTEVEEIKKKNKQGTIVKALRKLEEKKGMLTPYDVVKEARDKKSALHNSFEWDDTEAGQKYRLMQARIMLTTVKVEFGGEKRELYYNTTVEIENVPVRGYFSIERVMSEKALHQSVLREAIRELEYAQKKYNSLKEFRGVINTKKLNQLKQQIAG